MMQVGASSRELGTSGPTREERSWRGVGVACIKLRGERNARCKMCGAGHRHVSRWHLKGETSREELRSSRRARAGDGVIIFGRASGLTELGRRLEMRSAVGEGSRLRQLLRRAYGLRAGRGFFALVGGFSPAHHPLGRHDWDLV